MNKLYSSTAAEDGVVAVDRPANVDEIIATNISASPRFLHIVDAAALPIDTTSPDICIAIGARSTVSWDPERGGSSDSGVRFTAGVVVYLSSTAAAKTITTANEGVFTVRGR